MNEDYQLYIIIALWSLLVLSLVEGILERIKKFPTPFEKFQETNEEVVDPELPIERLFQNATENQLYRGGVSVGAVGAIAPTASLKIPIDA